MEKKILECFLYSEKLKFSDVVKGVGERSNLVSYHLGKLVGSGVLSRADDWYTLSAEFEDLIPYVSDKKHVLSVILVHIGDDDEAFLVERKKRPYLGKLALPGGRMILGESIEEGALRILKKFGVKGEFGKINSVSLEHLKRGGKVVASYLLIYVSASAEVDMVNLEENGDKIIDSDLLLMKGDFGKKVLIKEIDSFI